MSHLATEICAELPTRCLSPQPCHRNGLATGKNYASHVDSAGR